MKRTFEWSRRRRRRNAGPPNQRLSLDIIKNKRQNGIAPLSTLTSRATHAHPTSPRSTGFCAIWGCISSSSSSSSSSRDSNTGRGRVVLESSAVPCLDRQEPRRGAPAPGPRKNLDEHIAGAVLQFPRSRAGSMLPSIDRDTRSRDELELIQTQMTQKPELRVEGRACVAQSDGRRGREGKRVQRPVGALAQVRVSGPQNQKTIARRNFPFRVEPVPLFCHNHGATGGVTRS